MPTVELSNRYLDSVPRPEVGVVRHWDSVTTGFAAFVQPNATTLYFQYDRKGKTRRVNLGRYPTVCVNKARDAARQIDYEVRFGKAKHLDRREIALKDALTSYLEATEACAAHIAFIRRSISVRLEDWLSYPLSEITGAMIREQHRKLTADGPVMADETMRAFRSVWNAARDERPDLPPCPTDILRKRAGKKQTTWNNPQPSRNKPIRDLATWREAVERIINPVHREFYIFALLTACRKSEVANIEWEHISREDRTLTIPTTKSGREHYLPLNDHHFAILDRLLPKQGPNVFPDRSGKRPIVHPRHNDVPGTLHSLRHTWASVAAEIGMSEDQIGRILNHSNGMRAVTSRYIHVYVDSMRPIMDAVTDELVRRCEREAV